MPRPLSFFCVGVGKEKSPYVVLCNRERPKSGSYFNLPRTQVYAVN